MRFKVLIALGRENIFPSQFFFVTQKLNQTNHLICPFGKLVQGILRLNAFYMIPIDEKKQSMKTTIFGDVAQVSR